MFSVQVQLKQSLALTRQGIHHPIVVGRIRNRGHVESFVKMNKEQPLFENETKTAWPQYLHQFLIASHLGLV